MNPKRMFTADTNNQGTFLVFPTIVVRLVWDGQGYGDFRSGCFALQHTGAEPLVELYTTDYPDPPFRLCYHTRYTASQFLETADQGEGIEIGVECLSHALIPAEAIDPIAVEVRRLTDVGRAAPGGCEHGNTAA